MSASAITGEVHCLACGRYLANVAEGTNGILHLRPINGERRPLVALRQGRPFCSRCGGRAFVETESGGGRVFRKAAA
jgi:hypothetical protein